MINTNCNLFIVILAGGVGRRLWPVSRRAFPKQFLDLFGTGETMLQTASKRAAKLAGEANVLVVTGKEYEDVARQQLPWLPYNNLLVEPVHRNTCPAAAWAVHRIEQNDTDAVVVFMPADQLILHEDVFESEITRGVEYVSKNDSVLTIGVKPSRPEPGYGYIQFEGSGDEVRKVKSFVEKPNRDFAKMLLESGEFLWNTGIYLARVGCIRIELKKLLPYVMRDYRCTVEEEIEFVKENYSKYPNLSLDLAILEKMPNCAVMKANFGWADIGTWHGIYEAVQHNINDNVVVNGKSRAITEDSHQNIVSLPDGKVAILSGIDGMIVAEKGNVLLICPKGESSNQVRKYLTMAENDDTLDIS